MKIENDQICILDFCTPDQKLNDTKSLYIQSLVMVSQELMSGLRWLVSQERDSASAKKATGRIMDEDGKLMNVFR